MSAKRLKQLAAALIALLALWGLSALAFRPHHDRLGSLALPHLSALTLDSITIVSPGGADTVRLARRDSSWTADGWRASKQYVSELAEALGDTAGVELVSRSAAAEHRLGVDAAAGYRVRARQGARTLVDLVVGKVGEGYGSAYVRPAGGNDTYLLHSNLHGDVARSLDDWRDRTVVAVPRDSVSAILVGGRHAYTLQRDGKAWRLQPSGAPADSSAVARLLGALEKVSATGFATPAQRDSARWGPASPRILARGPHGDTLADLALDSTKVGYWVRSAGDSLVYRIPLSVGQELTPARAAVGKK